MKLRYKEVRDDERPFSKAETVKLKPRALGTDYRASCTLYKSIP